MVKVIDSETEEMFNDELLSELMVKVSRLQQDDRTTLCGSTWDGINECWWIPIHKAKYIREIFGKQYLVHKTTKPKEEVLEIMKRNIEEEKKEKEVKAMSPEEKITWLEEQLANTKQLKREIDEVTIVKCEHEGCEWEGTKIQYAGHKGQHARKENKEKRVAEIGVDNG